MPEPSTRCAQNLEDREVQWMAARAEGVRIDPSFHRAPRRPGRAFVAVAVVALAVAGIVYASWRAPRGALSIGAEATPAGRDLSG